MFDIGKDNDNYIRFDWAAKRLLRQKSNFVIIEGFLSTLLEEDIHIVKMLESESNKASEIDKSNRVDMLAENSRGELLIIEVQNNREQACFHRIIYGAAKAITDGMSIGNEYDMVRKVYSIHIIYFETGQGDDYVYRGNTEFRGIRTNDVLRLSRAQQKRFEHEYAGELFPEYCVLRVNEFDRQAVTPLDEWISFLKTSEIPSTVRAQGLQEARKILLHDRLNARRNKQINQLITGE